MLRLSRILVLLAILAFLPGAGCASSRPHRRDHAGATEERERSEKAERILGYLQDLTTASAYDWDFRRVPLWTYSFRY